MTNKVYNAVETALTFTDSGGDYTLTLANLAFAAGRISARADKGAGSQASLFKVRGIFQFDTAPEQGETVNIYISESDGTNADGNVGTSDAAADEDQLRNLKFVGSVVAEEAAADDTFEASFLVNIYQRYFSLVVWNFSAADNLKNTSGVNKVIVTPVPPEIQ